MSIINMLYSEDVSNYIIKQLADEERFRDNCIDRVINRAEKFLLGTLLPAVPDKRLISKMGINKKRVIYLFPPEDLIAMKTINYCINRLDLGLLPCCFAFRPGHSIQEGFRKIIKDYRPELSCIRLDIRDYFNSIPPDLLINRLEKHFLIYPELMQFLRTIILSTDVMINGEIHKDTRKGAMAGMPLAPLLANLYLSDFDEWAASNMPIYGRYSDDIIIFCPHHQVTKIFNRVCHQLTERKLVVNDTKTYIIQPGEKWEFLGLSYHLGKIDLSKGTIEKMKGKISRAGRKLYRWRIKREASIERAAKAMIRKFQYKLYGSGMDDDELTWSRWFFPLITESEGLHNIDLYFQQWIRYLATGRHTKKNYQVLPYSKLQELGYTPLVSVYYKKERDPSIVINHDETKHNNANITTNSNILHNNTKI